MNSRIAVNSGRALWLATLLMLLLPVAGAAGTPGQEGAQKAILVTGASSGIGRRVTELLASKGNFVYAGARKQEDLDALNALDNVEAVRLDVTKQDEINAAVETVRNGKRGLYGLVNNAGVFTGGPMIIESKGRIINMSSISGVLDWPMGGLYTMSKHAVEAYNDTLALELARFGVAVSALEPGDFKSEISSSARSRIASKGVKAENSLYTDDWAELTDGPADRSQYKEPEAVAEAVVHALFDARPKPRYLVVPDQEEAGWTIGEAIQELVELNADQPFSYSREQLIEMIDAAMAAPD
jgi:NAD(P)-dependent dehydrogenase (short-subunit alcohol dehydrogenase family)